MNKKNKNLNTKSNVVDDIDNESSYQRKNKEKISKRIVNLLCVMTIFIMLLLLAIIIYFFIKAKIEHDKEFSLNYQITERYEISQDERYLQFDE